MSQMPSPDDTRRMDENVSEWRASAANRRCVVVQAVLGDNQWRSEMTDYQSLSAADLNAAIAVRVCGVSVHYHCGIAFTDEIGLMGLLAPKRYSTELDACFVAQAALAAKGEQYEDAWLDVMRGFHAIMDEERQPQAGWFLANASARTRCVAMLQAIDAAEES